MKRKSKYRFPCAPKGDPRLAAPHRAVEDLAAGIAQAPEILADPALSALLAEAGIAPSAMARALKPQDAPSGDLPEAQSMLAAQATMLDRMFHHLSQLALSADPAEKQFTHYVRLALKAQAQSAQAARTLAQLGQGASMPPNRQAQAAKPQAINNRAPGRSSPPPLAAPTISSQGQPRHVPTPSVALTPPELIHLSRLQGQAALQVA